MRSDKIVWPGANGDRTTVAVGSGLNEAGRSPRLPGATVAVGSGLNEAGRQSEVSWRRDPRWLPVKRGKQRPNDSKHSSGR
jgi:hypothetical protein